MRHGILALAVTLAATTSTFGAVAWSPASGSTATFDYANGQNAAAMLGSPLVSDTGFTFIPSGYFSSTSNTGSAGTTDGFSVDLDANPALQFNIVDATLTGDFTVSGVGSVNSLGTLTVTNLDTLTFLTTPLTFTGTPASTIASTDGEFTGTASLALPAGWSNVRVAFSDTLSSSAGANSSSLIQGKLLDVELTTGANVNVPEPTVTITAGAAMLGLLRRARRSTKA